jgi:hypothetical protein
MYLADRDEEDKGHRGVAEFVENGSWREEKIEEPIFADDTAQDPRQQMGEDDQCYEAGNHYENLQDYLHGSIVEGRGDRGLESTLWLRRWSGCRICLRAARQQNEEEYVSEDNPMPPSIQNEAAQTTSIEPPPQPDSPKKKVSWKWIVLGVFLFFAVMAIIGAIIGPQEEAPNSSEAKKTAPSSTPSTTLTTPATSPTTPLSTTPTPKQFSEEERKQIYYELAKYQDSIPYDPPAEWTRLNEESYQLFATKYGTTKDVIDKIAIEGATKGWPMPEPPTP